MHWRLPLQTLTILTRQKNVSAPKTIADDFACKGDLCKSLHRLQHRNVAKLVYYKDCIIETGTKSSLIRFSQNFNNASSENIKESGSTFPNEKDRNGSLEGKIRLSYGDRLKKTTHSTWKTSIEEESIFRNVTYLLITELHHRSQRTAILTTSCSACLDINRLPTRHCIA